MVPWVPVQIAPTIAPAGASASTAARGHFSSFAAGRLEVGVALLEEASDESDAVRHGKARGLVAQSRGHKLEFAGHDT
jgi:hypothetical protein